MPTRLFHFSDDDSIEAFVPRPVRVPSQRPPGFAWLNGPLVWAIDDWHQPMYLFPRDCPRILLWRTGCTTDTDFEKYFAGSQARIIAYVEERWASKLGAEVLHRYELPTECFESLEGAGMWVSKAVVTPLKTTRISNLETELLANDVELRALPVLTSLRNVWDSTLHASGIRLRNAQQWES